MRFYPIMATFILSMLFLYTPAGAGTGVRVNSGSDHESKNAMNNSTHLKKSDTVADLLHHPAFKEFGVLLLPKDSDAANTGLRLDGVGSLMPYHNHVNSDTILTALNHMIDEANKGHTLFYDFYTEEEKRSDPSKKSSGFFFLRGKVGAPFAVICPGGGFAYVGSLHEGVPYAMELNKKGYNAFVLKYRVGGGGLPATQDLAAALSFIFANAEQFEVGISNYSLWGSSAGARMAAAIGSSGAAAFGGRELPRPGAIVMAYTGHSTFTANDPPTFAVVSADDGIANPATVEERIKRMQRAGIAAEFQGYRNAGHGFGLGNGTDAEGWFDDAIRFWEKHMTR